MISSILRFSSMFFLSQILHVPIYDSYQEMVGRVKDVVVRHKGEEYPVVTKIIFTKGGKDFSIHHDYFELLGPGEITLNKRNCFESWNDTTTDEIPLNRDVMDQQIFDIKKVRVVRANDVQLTKIKDHFSILAIDISSRALLRRLGFPFDIVKGFFKPKFIDWHNLNFIEGAAGSFSLNTPYRKLKQLHPADIANLLEHLTLAKGSQLVQAFDEKTAAKVLAEVGSEYKKPLLKTIHSKDLASILEAMSTDDAADAIRRLPHYKKLRVFKRLGIHKARILNQLMQYNEDIAGGLMAADYFSINESATIQDAIDEIKRRSEEHRSIYHLFVVDDSGVLKGIMSLRTLLLTPHHTKVSEAMSPVLATVIPSAPLEEVARILTKYNLLSVAVVDEEKKLRGAITVDDVMRHFVPSA
ncbi:magnesium transporter [Candidatus Peregrinibacteria bacterium]|nr:magnesium transporter [Candidatus Peregrinibacteria bacterium]